MRQLLFGVGVLLIIISCSTQKGAVKVERSANETVVSDSMEYGMETFDAKFESWYLMYKSPALYRSQSYYENWNKQYVTAWNIKAMDGRKNSFFETIIGYDPNVDYGFELNHELFHYFQYVEQVLKIKIIQGGPRVVPN